ANCPGRGVQRHEDRLCLRGDIEHTVRESGAAQGVDGVTSTDLPLERELSDIRLVKRALARIEHAVAGGAGTLWRLGGRARGSRRRGPRRGWTKSESRQIHLGTASPFGGGRAEQR